MFSYYGLFFLIWLIITIVSRGNSNRGEKKPPKPPVRYPKSRPPNPGGSILEQAFSEMFTLNEQGQLIKQKTGKSGSANPKNKKNKKIQEVLQQNEVVLEELSSPDFDEKIPTKKNLKNSSSVEKVKTKRTKLQKAIIYSEVIGKPKSLR